MFLYPGGARYEWTPVIQGFGQRGSVEAVSGWALNVHESDKDVPFTHPFGKIDFGYLLLPDPSAQPLLAPNNTELDDDRVKAVAEAAARGLPLQTTADGTRLQQGVLGVEQEVGLIPDAYRPRTGDRVALFGRWIVDCGHDNWQSEIHPPVVTAVARQNVRPGQTHVDISSNGYLVDQEFSHGGLRAQLMYELALVQNPIAFIPFTDQVSAEANVMSTTVGAVVFSFQMRPPTPAPSANHKLYVRMHLTGRPGVVVQPFLVDDSTVAVVGLLTEGLTMKPITNITRWNVTGDDLDRLHPFAGKFWTAMVAQSGPTGLNDPVKGWVLSRGIRGVLFDAPVPPDLSGAPVTEGWAVTAPWGQNPVRYLDQPFPVIGWIEVEWRLPPSIIGSQVDLSAWAAVQRHLDEVHMGGPTGAERAAELLPHVAQVSPMPPRGVADLTGQWDYRASRDGRTPEERGKVWLRSNGAFVQGVLDLGTNRREGLEGTMSRDGSSLALTRTAPSGAKSVIRFSLKGSRYIGSVEGSRAIIELFRP